MFAQFTTFERHFTFHLVQSSASAQYLYTERVPHPMTSGIPEIIYKQTQKKQVNKIITVTTGHERRKKKTFQTSCHR